ncbi:MAG: hypothetical protein H7645_12900, partial [Candidatus Heimdallarchaeota archaeon]|nr:hypothetical protein [Candidatus Heimdallarchaeota archaeon]
MASTSTTKSSVVNKIDQIDFLTECVNIAIGEETGSPYLIKLAKEKGINKGDINDWVDLA